MKIQIKYLLVLLLFCSPAFGASTDTICDTTTDCKLLLHENGADASIVHTDSAQAKTVSPNGDAQLDTAQKKFGTASGLLDGTGDFLSIHDDSDFAIGSGAWTIDCWIRMSSLPGSFYTVASQTDTGNYSWVISIYKNAPDDYHVAYQYSLNGTDSFTLIDHAMTISANTWYHFACVRTGDTIKIFLDGNLVDSQNLGAGDSLYNSTADFLIGSSCAGGSPGVNPFAGWIDEFRFIKGTAVWTGAFTAPSAEYTGGSTESTRKRMILMS